ncbi:MAG: dihydrofolate reductase [Candidatus Pacebacteria bacterium]|nr:dihydrofolate reductase [Candidatus Paceibacterota bacterium]
MLSIISAIANNNEIGRRNELLWDLPIDMKHFKEITTGHPIIMGQKTFESIGRPLPNRRNIVITLDETFKKDGVEIVYSIDEMDLLLKNTMKENEEAFIIGGGQIYKLFIYKADKLYITHVNAEFSDADTYFPIIDTNKWEKISEDKHSRDEKNIYDCNFVVYKKML